MKGVLYATSGFSARRESVHHSCSIHLLLKTKELCGMAWETSQISLTCLKFERYGGNVADSANV